jgi:hypothetical protein
MTVETLWRIVSGGRIVVTSLDDGQMFGLPEPVDAETTARGILQGMAVTRALVDRETADVTLDFGPSVRLQVLPSYSGYEAWNAHFNDGERNCLIVATSGGELTIFRL